MEFALILQNLYALRMTQSDIISQLATAIANKHQDNALIVGINGAQGSGKSTLCKKLKAILEKDDNLRTVVISIDDLYKTKAERQKLARDVHPLFITRGVPGTHDVFLGIDILEKLKNSNAKSSIRIPVFDKAIDDRAPESTWQMVHGKVDIVLFEGWCVGAKPESDQALLKPVNSLEQQEDPSLIWRRYVNTVLAGEYQELFALLDMLIMLKIKDFELVYQHRLQQEQDLAKTTDNTVMSPKEIKRFIMHYERLTRHMLQTLPQKADIVISVDALHLYYI